MRSVSMNALQSMGLRTINEIRTNLLEPCAKANSFSEIG